MRSKAAAALAAILFAAGPAWAACCYFAAKDKDILQPGQKAFICWYPSEKVESFTVQPRFEGNALDFGMVIPTPSRPKLDEMPRDFFKDLAIYTILMPLPQAIDTNLSNWERMMRKSEGGRPVPAPSGMPGGGPLRDKGVKVLEAGVVGSLDYKIIVAENATGLFEWLKENAYSYSGDESTLDFYIAKKWFFTVMKIDSKAMKKNPDGSYLGEVTPTRFTFETERCIYPLKITQISVKDKTDALFYVQSAQQLDLEGDLSWMHSYRTMYLTFMLGCGATPEQQKELEERNRWIQAKRAKDPAFETTKLEWAHKLGDAEMAVLENPVANYAQAAGGDLPPSARWVTVKEMCDEAWSDYEKQVKSGGDRDDDYAKKKLEQIRTTWSAPGRGKIARFEGRSPYFSKFAHYPNREAPEADVKGLTRLKGHLQKGKWLTKFRKQVRKDEMSDDLVLVPVTDGSEQDYVRIMPTSPP